MHLSEISLAYVVIGDDNEWIRSEYTLLCNLDKEALTVMAEELQDACLIYSGEVSLGLLNTLFSDYRIGVDVAGSVDVPPSMLSKDPIPYAASSITCVLFSTDGPARIYSNESRYMATALAILHSRNRDVRDAVLNCG